MTMETYNAITTHMDQIIAIRSTSNGLLVIMYAWNETVDTIISIARNANHKVSKRIIDKGAPDSEIHLIIY